MTRPPSEEQKVSALLAELKQCSNRGDLQQGRALHLRAVESGCQHNKFVATALITMYCKCRSTRQARDVFDAMVHRDVVPWNIIILGYVENGESSKALDLFTSMDCEPSEVTFIGALKACTALASEKQLEKQVCLEKGMDIHRQVKERGFDTNVFVATTLVDMYSACGSMLQARSVFDNMAGRNVVVWNILILGYVEHGEGSVALDLFNSMDCEADSFTFVAALKACGSVAAVGAGERIHAQVCKLGLEQVQVVENCLVDFYVKCGNMAAAEQVFIRMHSCNTASWNALIAGYNSLGDTFQVFRMVNQMQEGGLQLDSITFCLILTTCSHAGMVEEGIKYFNSMSRYGVKPDTEHYACMVDILGRADRFEDALSIVNSMPESDSVVWKTLLGACRNLNNLQVGKVAFGACDHNDAPSYLMMGDIYRNVEG